MEQDVFYMRKAIELAKKGLFTTDPNPRVGCVIVKDGEILGEGYHVQAGQPHAEVYALRQAGLLSVGATAYVTLEPCSHYGRTPPCAHALINAGIKRVVVGMEDPNPQVHGNGIRALKEAGIEIALSVCEKEVRALNPGFIARFTQGKPFVRLKMGASLDGRTAMASGESKWITSTEARLDVQYLRARSACIITGINTVIKDAALLSVRPETWTESSVIYPRVDFSFGQEGYFVRQPLRIILDSQFMIEASHPIFAQPGKTIIVVGDWRDFSALNAAKVAAKKAVWPESEQSEVWCLPISKEGIDLVFLLQKLAQMQINEVLVEAGSTLAGSFLSAHLVDECVLYLAPKFLGSTARPLVGVTIDRLQDALQFTVRDISKIGSDIKVTLISTC